MSRSIEKIEIVFENCETLVIPIQRIGYFIIDDIHHNINRTSMNSIEKIDIADTIFIEIFNRKRNKKLYRICNYNDITQIWLTYDTLEEECYFTDYKEPEGHENDLGAPNINQSTYIQENGDILLTIAAGKDWHDFISLNDRLDKDDIRYFLYDAKEDDEIDGNLFTPDYYEEAKLIEEENNNE